MDLGLSEKVVLVTGGSRGIGRASALALAAEGCRVATCARGREQLDQAVGELRGLSPNSWGGVADVTKAE